jgi:hypothetical protein
MYLGFTIKIIWNASNSYAPKIFRTHPSDGVKVMTAVLEAVNEAQQT